MKLYIGICKKSPQGNSNYGTVWEEGEDGMFRSKEDEYIHRRGLILSRNSVANDVFNGYLVELHPETILTLQTKLGRNPTTIELADYITGVMVVPMVPEEFFDSSTN